MHSQPRLAEAFATARITAFKPGQSPPPVTTPIRLLLGLLYCLCGQPGAAVFADERDAFIHRLCAMRNFKIDLACEFGVFVEHRAARPPNSLGTPFSFDDHSGLVSVAGL